MHSQEFENGSRESIPVSTLLLEQEGVAIVANTDDRVLIDPQEVDEGQVSVANSLSGVLLSAAFNNAQSRVVASISESRVGNIVNKCLIYHNNVCSSTYWLPEGDHLTV